MHRNFRLPILRIKTYAAPIRIAAGMHDAQLVKATRLREHGIIPVVSIRAAAQLQVVHRAKIAAGIQLHAVGRGDPVIPDGEAANRPTSGVDIARNVEGACDGARKKHGHRGRRF